MRIVTDYKHAQQIIIELDARIAKLEADRDEWERLWKKASVAVIDLQDEVEKLKEDRLDVKEYVAKLEADKCAWEACAQGHYEALSKANKRIAELEAEVKALWLEKIERDNVADREVEKRFGYLEGDWERRNHIIESQDKRITKLEAAIVERDSIIARLLGDTTPVDGYCGRRSSKAGLQAGEAEE